MALSESRRLYFKNTELRISRTLSVASGKTIYKGAILGIDGSGNVIPAATGNAALGIAVEEADAEEDVQIYHNHIVRFPIDSVAKTDIGSTAYAADDEKVQTGSNSAVLGPIVDVDTNNNYAWVHLTLK